MNFVIACLRPSQNLKLGIFTGSRAVDGKEMCEKRYLTSVRNIVSGCVSKYILDTTQSSVKVPYLKVFKYGQHLGS